jgi:mannobiose 2-epimerase
MALAPISKIPASERNIFLDEIRFEMNHLLDWWIEHMVDHKHGGFYGRIDGFGRLHPDAEKGVILNARLLWTFSAVASYSGEAQYAKWADRAYHYFTDHFLDKQNGGVFWSVDAKGDPVDTTKQIYAQVFAVYALSEYYELRNHPTALQVAQQVFRLVETHSRDRLKSGYHNVFDQDWTPAKNQRLSEKDEDQAKIMNTHLHIMEAYANLYRVAPNPTVKEALSNSLLLLMDRFCARSPRHLYLFFDENWNPSSEEHSFGHDIECAWLLVESARILGDTDLLHRAASIAIELANSTLEQGTDKEGGIFEKTDATGLHIEPEKHWWPQAEAVVGLLQAFELTGDPKYWNGTMNAWQYIKKYFKDREQGEWHWLVDEQGHPILHLEDKAGPWKAPYHNVRMCLEVLKRLDK